MKEKVVIIGAGSAMFTAGLVADLLASGWEAELALVDIDQSALEVAERMTRKMIQARQAPVKLAASTDRRDVLSGATAVICTVGVGGRRGWEADVLIPREFGVFQPVGDTVGPGGTSRAMRMIPAMVAIAGDVLAQCPDALFFNYSNPMTAVCRAIRKATGAPVVGLCHGVDEVGHYLAGQLGVPRPRFHFEAVGLNHLTWFVRTEVDGKDAKGRLLEIAEGKLARERVWGSLAEKFLEDWKWQRPPEDPEELNPASWGFLESFGAFPAAMDRHVTEFFGGTFLRRGGYFGRTLGTESYSFECTIAGGDREFAIMSEQTLSDRPLDESLLRHSSGEHEQVIDIIESIRTNSGRIFSANLPNAARFANLPEEAVVEAPAVASAEGLRPVRATPL
ncbi:MAG: hypothetical protein V1794_01980, partial [Candidatus Glassbacteria bacterium]